MKKELKCQHEHVTNDGLGNICQDCGAMWSNGLTREDVLLCEELDDEFNGEDTNETKQTPA